MYGWHFTIRTDHGSLKWLHTFKEPEDQLARWLDVLAEYDYTIICRPGVQHRNADALSMRTCNGKGCLCTSLQSKEQVSVSSQTDELIGKISVLSESLEGNPEVTEESDVRLCDVANMKAAQVEDSSVGPVYEFVQGSEPHPSWEQFLVTLENERRC